MNPSGFYVDPIFPLSQIFTLTRLLWRKWDIQQKKVRRNDEPFLLFLLDLNQGPSD